MGRGASGGGREPVGGGVSRYTLRTRPGVFSLAQQGPPRACTACEGAKHLDCETCAGEGVREGVACEACGGLDTVDCARCGEGR